MRLQQSPRQLALASQSCLSSQSWRCSCCSRRSRNPTRVPLEERSRRTESLHARGLGQGPPTTSSTLSAFEHRFQRAGSRAARLGPRAPIACGPALSTLQEVSPGLATVARRHDPRLVSRGEQLLAGGAHRGRRPSRETHPRCSPVAALTRGSCGSTASPRSSSGGVMRPWSSLRRNVARRRRRSRSSFACYSVAEYHFIADSQAR